MKTEKTDYHCHLLPAIDDGAADLEQSLRIARTLSGFGFTTVYCTPHLIKGCYENLPERVTELTAALQQMIDRDGLKLTLVPGTEHYLDEYLPYFLPHALTVGPQKHLLVEAPFRSSPESAFAAVTAIFDRGLRPLLAHPERCTAFAVPAAKEGFAASFSRMFVRDNPSLPEAFAVSRFLRSGCGFQANIGSFAGVYGREVKERALTFLKNGVYSCVGSDAHRCADLDVILTAGCRAITAAIGQEEAEALLSGIKLQQ